MTSQALAHNRECFNREVYMAKNKQNQEVVAIKKIRSLNEVQGVRIALVYSCDIQSNPPWFLNGL
jgi:hypothetical protein